MKHNIALIIPCYNEEKRLEEENIKQLLAEIDLTVFFANDGSTDDTLSVLERIALLNPDRIKVLNYAQNGGKGNVVYKAANDILKEKRYDYIGYYDADFATPVSELGEMIERINKNSHVNFIFASRIKRLNSNIERSPFRHYVGRVVTTIINLKFKLAIYDTQCGAKILSKEIVEAAFEKPFYTSWLFDVEMFIRLRKKGLLQQSEEFFISEWKDVGGSKLHWTHGFKILGEIIKLYTKY